MQPSICSCKIILHDFLQSLLGRIVANSVLQHELRKAIAEAKKRVKVKRGLRQVIFIVIVSRNGLKEELREIKVGTVKEMGNRTGRGWIETESEGT